MKSNPVSVKTHLTSTPAGATVTPSLSISTDLLLPHKATAAPPQSFASLPLLLEHQSALFPSKFMLLLSNISFASLLTHPMLLPHGPSPLRPVVREQGSDHMTARAASCGGESGSGDVAALDRPEWGNNDQLTVHTKAVWWGGGDRLSARLAAP